MARKKTRYKILEDLRTSYETVLAMATRRRSESVTRDRSATRELDLKVQDAELKLGLIAQIRTYEKALNKIRAGAKDYAVTANSVLRRYGVPRCK